MKSIKHRLLSLLLTLVTVLSLLPTAAFAASNTGSGLKITTNQAYWSTRLLANGTPYSYRPPLVDGKLVYCMDSGLGYHYATPSYLNSFTWTSGTGADADAVLQSALTNSGLSEMDAATVENVKWMMTYLNDCKESNVGQLFMAVQTYVWENQSYKGEPGGDGDAGGYANADTYELYLSLIDSLLAKKAAEDAEFQRQIEEYAAQGITATIVEDESAGWAVYAISSNRKNQSFFNYYGPRKLVTGEPAPDQPEQPTGGTGKIVLKKTAGGTTTGLASARFSIYFNGQIVGSDITNAQGEIYVEDAATGLWSFVETSAPDGYCVDPTPKSVYVDVTEGDREYTVAAINYEKPDMKIIKTDAQTGAPIPGTVLSIKSVKTVYVSPGKTVEIEWENTAVTGQIQIYKYAAEYNEVTGTAAGTPLKGAVYEIVNARSGKVVDYITTDARGVAASKPLPLTRYQLREVTAPAYWQLDPTVHDVTLEYPGQIIKLSAYDKPSSLGVSITKRGNAQVMAGQSMRYDLTVANTSNVPLESFFWHDKIPYDVARPTTLTTGTYSARLNYRVLYKTNYNASYQVLASNLLTSNNYSFSLNAIPMQAGEVVTDIYFDFGKVPVGFQSTVNPTLSVMVNGNAVNGYQMVNRADVGGKYQDTWQTATASWVTVVRRLWSTPTLPKTGY